MKNLFLLSTFLFTFFQVSMAQIPKKALVEKYTSAGCGNCPDGTARLLDITANNSNIIWVSHHAGWINDALGNPTLDTIASAFTSGAPKATIDRVKFSNESEVAANRPNWSSHISTQLAAVAEVDVQVTGNFNPSTNLIEVQVSATFDQAVTANGEYRVNVFVVEDSVVGSGSGFDQANYFNNTSGHYYQSAGNPILNYPHRHVVRDVPSAAWGTPSVIPNSPTVNTTYTANYIYNLPNGYDAAKVRFVAFVTDHSASANQREVLNANQTNLMDFNMTTNTIETPTFVSDFKIQPNPAYAFTNLAIESNDNQEVSIVVTNITGQEVFSNNSQLLNIGQNIIPIDTQRFTSGVYFVSIRKGNNIATQRLVVSK